MEQLTTVMRFTKRHDDLAAVHDVAAKFGCPAGLLQSAVFMLSGQLPVSEEDYTRQVYALIERTPKLMDVLKAQDYTFCELVERIAALHSAGDAYIGRDQFKRPQVYCDRPVTFCFADDMEWPGMTDDTYWNGFLNVTVDAETFAKIKHYFLVDCGCDPEEIQMDDIEPGDDGRYSLAYGFATSEVEPEPDYGKCSDCDRITGAESVGASCRKCRGVIEPVFES